MRAFKKPSIAIVKENGVFYIGILKEYSNGYLIKYPAIVEFDKNGSWKLNNLPVESLHFRNRSTDVFGSKLDKILIAWYVAIKRLHDQFKDIVDIWSFLESYLFRKRFGDTVFNLPYPLPSGEFSNDGSDGSFLGQYFIGIVEEATGFDLKTENLSPDDVKKISFSLQKWWNSIKENDREKVLMKYYTRREIVQWTESLVELFKQAAEKGCRYYGWFTENESRGVLLE